MTLRIFDNKGRLLEVIDPLERRRRLAHNAFNEVIEVIDPLGQVTKLGYDAAGRIQTIEDPLGRMSRILYDSTGNPTALLDPLGATTRLAYDIRGDLVSISDPLGHVTTFEHDTSGNLIARIDASGHELRWTYDLNGRILSATEARLLPDGESELMVTTHRYDALGRLTEMVLPNGSSYTQSFDAMGNLLRDVDAMGRAFEYRYDPSGRRIETRYPDGTSLRTTYDAEGRPITTTDRAGRSTVATFDPLDRLVDLALPDGSTRGWAYDAAGQLIAQTDGEGRTTTRGYDLDGRLRETIDPLGHPRTFGYDAAGNLVSETDANGHTTVYLYDGSDRLTTIEHPDSSETELSYDAIGRIVSMSDAAGSTTSWTYDVLGRLDSVSDTLGQSTRFAYDAQGNLIRQTDANQRTTSFEYDALGRLLGRILPDGTAESWTYLADGTPASHRDLSGATTTSSYDSNARLVSRRYYDGTRVDFTYSPTGRRLTSTGPGGTTSFEYDALDRLRRKVDPEGRELRYTYNADGDLTSLTTVIGDSTRIASYGYDEAGRLVTVIDGEGGLYRWSYDAEGNPTELVRPSGVRTTRAYDSRDRIASLGSTAADGTVLTRFDIGRGASGEILQVVEADGTSRSFAYDGLYRLTREQTEDATGALVARRDYAYDAVGNRISETATDAEGQAVSLASTYDTRDRLLSHGETTYTWDANGNLVGTVEVAGETSYRWDARGLLRAVVFADGRETHFDYDGEGHRVGVRVVGVDGGVEEVDLLTDSRGLLSHIVAEVESEGPRTIYTRGGELLALHRPDDGSTLDYHHDATGSIRALSDAVGVVTDRYSYGAFGELLENSGDTLNPYRFMAEPADPTTGFYHLRARWLQPGLGRFASMDPFPGWPSRERSLHRYLYADGDPVNGADPTGLFSAVEMGVVNAVRAEVTAIQATIFKESLRASRFGKDPGIQQILEIIDTLEFVAGVTAVATGVFMAARALGGKMFRRVLGFRALRSGGHPDPPSPPRGACFAAGTLVHSERGMVPVEEIEVGDRVWSRSEATGEEGFREVRNQFERHHQPVLELTLEGEASSSRENLEVTAEHPFWLRGKGWAPASTLRTGDLVRGLAGGWLRVSSNVWTQRRATVYNLEVAENHTYFAGQLGAWVHNTCQGRYSGELVKSNQPDANADLLGDLLGGESRVKFANDTEGREFDAITDQYIGQTTDRSTVGSAWRHEARATFEAAQETGRAVYFHFNGEPHPEFIRRLMHYYKEYDVDMVIDRIPFH